eukprot:CAMPEP_0176501484 /NCGR_PEP_ID=MMETSP0200_2-20121128/14183_1 /TAXON_ID=947934 /ORGANISM="Chaetoceros sp., Strain GSL56" /LENGTH=296 /DNA_ID=CAMNT_0017900369 /DNA_START=36 /DNA_END=926 /DNA_ORIENTATION=+
MMMIRAPSISLSNTTWNKICIYNFHSYESVPLSHMRMTAPSSPPTQRYFSHESTTTTPSSSDNNQTTNAPPAPAPAPVPPATICYEGPFASLALRLKQISITSAAASLVGIPMLMTFGSNLPPSGQLAVGGTAILAATGSTAALSFCFSPYIHTLEWIPVRQCKICKEEDEKDKQQQKEEEVRGQEQEQEQSKCQKLLLKATTRNVLAMKVETVFDPDIDVTHDPKTYRPFCNFMVKGKPFFIHPELVKDDLLRIQLLGKEKGTLMTNNGDVMRDDSTTNTDANKKKKSDPDDEFI